jgi:hypothetical protein
MSFRELTMIDVREVLRRWQAGQSARAIARDGVADRKTAGRYIEAAAECAVTCTDELTDAVVARIAETVQARPAPERSDPRLLLDHHRQRIEAWLRQDKPLKLVRIHELLKRWCRCLVHHAAAIRPRRVRLARAHADGASR